jgi:hypothetical protein
MLSPGIHRTRKSIRKFLWFRGRHMKHESDHFLPFLFTRYQRQLHFLKLNLIFSLPQSCTADHYESNDHKLSSMLRNRLCDISPHSTRASCNHGKLGSMKQYMETFILVFLVAVFTQIKANVDIVVTILSYCRVP